MKVNADQVRGPIPSSVHVGSPANCAAASAWRGKRLRAQLDDEAAIDRGGDIPHHPIASDDQVLATAQLGDQQAFVELCRRHSPMVRKRILSIVRNQEDAEDALQDTLLRAHKHLGTFRQTCRFSTWLTSIGTNTALMILRKRKTRREGHTEFLNGKSGTWQIAEYADSSLDPEGLHSRQQIILLVRREVRKLRPALRSAIEQHYGAESSLEESAKALHISVSAAKSRLSRGRKTLRWYLERRGILEPGV